MPKHSTATSLTATRARTKARSRIAKLLAHDIAIDLGTANTLVSVDGHGIVINEPSVVATNKKTGQVIAIGKDAKAMVGRTPKSILAMQPLVDGVVSDFEVTQHMLRSFVHDIHRQHRVLSSRPRMIIGLPSGVTEVEKRAVEEAARSSGARTILLIQEPVAAAIGTGIDILSERGSLIVDIGGGTTEIAVMANGVPILSRSIRIAGDELNDVIMSYVRDEFNLQIGKRTAEDVKINIGMVGGKAEPRSMLIRGRNIVTGLPQEIEISSDMVKTPLTRQLRPIIEAVKSLLDETPPEIISDIMEEGMYVAGGGALITGIDRLLRSETHIDVHVPQNALTAVVEGASIALANPQLYRRCLVYGK